QRVGPGGNDDSPDKADGRVHEGPAEIPAERKPDDDQRRYRRIRQNMDDGGAHIVVALRLAMGVLVLGKLDVVDFAAAIERHAYPENVRLGDFFERFEIAAARG